MRVRMPLFALVVLAPAVLALPGPGIAGEDLPRMIEVHGRGEVRAVPDVALVRVGVVRQGKDAATPRRQVAEAAAGLLERIRGAGIGDRDIRTGGAQIAPEWDWDKGRRLRGFTVRQSIEIRIRDLDRLGEILTSLAAAGADELDDAVFLLDDPRGFEREALKAAMADARSKAEALAESAGVRLGDVLVVREGGGESSPIPAARHVMMMAEAKADTLTPVVAGEQAIAASVTVRFALR